MFPMVPGFCRTPVKAIIPVNAFLTEFPSDEMSYPHSPFDKTFDSGILLCSSPLSENIRIQNVNRMQHILRWLCAPPKISSYRVNTLQYAVDDIKSKLGQKVTEVSDKRGIQTPLVEKSKAMPEVILIHSWDIAELNLEKKENEVIIDILCGAAVLRGAHIYAPGVLGMLSGTKIGDKVSVYVDVNGKCKKGLNKLYVCNRKIFVGNGICKMARYQLFGENLTPSGVAIEITDTISGCLPLEETEVLPKGSVLLQNIPSIVCVHTLQPRPGDTVLDMCASPGNKTTHIAALLQNKGTLVAIDKTLPKIEKLRDNCNNFNAKACIFQADSTKIFDDTISVQDSSICNGPPFAAESFNKILLDAPCSALGKRPQFICKVADKVLKSYVPLQKKLFETAVNLLKPGGRLVYSTCTVAVSENEEVVAWALRKFQCLESVKPELQLGGPGFSIRGLSNEQLANVQRFGPDSEVDSVGFFIACFIKKNSINAIK